MNAMKSISAYEVIRAERWSKALFTTYALSLSFVESVLLDVILRNAIPSATILADVSGVRAAMEECGAQAVGRDYEIEPVKVKNGCFHPKLMALISSTDAHLLVGSGNLTFGGWGANLECLEHLHPSFASQAFIDASAFLDSLADSPKARHAGGQQCRDVAGALRTAAGVRQKDGAIRILSSLQRSILDQIEQFAIELGGAYQLSVVSPFFDDAGLQQLCLRLRLPEVFVHVHDGGTVEGSAGTNWPQSAVVNIHAVTFHLLRETTSRELHAKMFEIRCVRGRLILSGSANATIAGLGPGGNVELCVLRIERPAATGWSYDPTDAPSPTLPREIEDNAKDSFAVLRATLIGRRVEGTIISQFAQGQASGFRRDGVDWLELGTTSVSANGTFVLEVDDMNGMFWGAQVMLRLVSEHGQVAKGFVSLPEARDITRRLGPRAAASFFAFLKRDETTRDLIAIMDYFQMHPSDLPGNPSGSQGARSDQENDRQDIVNMRALQGLIPLNQTTGCSHGRPYAWKAFMEAVYAAFREPRVPAQPESPKETSPKAANDASAKQKEKAAEKVTCRLGQLLNLMLRRGTNSFRTASAFHLMQYVCVAVSADVTKIRSYLHQILEAFVLSGVAEEQRPLYAAAVLLWGTQEEDIGTRPQAVRRYLLRGGLVLPCGNPDMGIVSGLMSLLPGVENSNSLWDQVMNESFPHEETGLFVERRLIPLLKEEYKTLRQTPDWDALVLRRQTADVRFMPKLLTYCPRCLHVMCSVDANRLRDTAVLFHQCGATLLCGEV